MLLAGRCLGQGDRDGGALAKGILIGLGGGYLAELLCQLFQADIHSIELDPAIVEIAKQHFGLKERPSLKVQSICIRAAMSYSPTYGWLPFL